MIYPVRFEPLLKVVLLLIVLLLWGCSETDDKIEPTYSSLWSNVFSNCALNCHSPGATGSGAENGPDFSTKDLFYTNTFNKTLAEFPNWTDRTGTCDSVGLISPNNADLSLILGSLVLSYKSNIETNFGGCTIATNVHEQTKNTIDDQETIDALTKWINDGAQNN